MMRTRAETIAMLEALSSYGVITYTLGEERRGENGPHLEILKGPRFAEGLPASAPRELHRLLETLASGEMQRRVDDSEGRTPLAKGMQSWWVPLLVQRYMRRGKEGENDAAKTKR